MINASNYFNEIKNVTVSQLPPALQKGHEFVNKVTSNGTDWKNYHESTTIQKVVDTYFDQLSKHLPETPSETVKEVKEQKRETTKEIKRSSSVKNKKTKQAETPDEKVELIERIPEELRLMKRYINLHGKKKNKEDILRLINALQKAILERRIRKESPWAKQVEHMQEALIQVYKKMKGAMLVEVNDKTLKSFKKEIEGEKEFLSIKLIKRYVNLHGKADIRSKAQKLYEQISQAVVNKKIIRNDKYALKLNEVWLSLKHFVEDKEKKTLPVNSAELNGLLGLLNGNQKKRYNTYKEKLKFIQKKGNIVTFKEPFYPKGTANESRSQILVRDFRKDKSGAVKIEGQFYDSNWYKNIQELMDAIDWEWMEDVHADDDLGCKCELNGTEEPSSQNKIMNSMDFANMTFSSIGLTGKWKELIGDPASGFTAMVFGKPKMGKSYLCVEFAGYLARNHGKVLYVAREEGLDATLQLKLNDKNVKHPNLFVSDFLPDDLSAYQFVFLDSVNKLGLTPEQLDALRKNNRGKSFVFVFQTTKEGNFRGKNNFQHDVDIVIEIPEKGKAVQFGRYNQGGEMQIFE